MSALNRKSSYQEEKLSFHKEMKFCQDLEEGKTVITKILPRTDCIIAFALREGKEIVIKITLADTEEDNSFSVERNIYRNIVPKMLKETPHLVKYIDDFVCTNFISVLRAMINQDNAKNKFVAATILKDLQDIATTSLKYKRIPNILSQEIHILLLEKVPGATLFDWLSSKLYTSLIFAEKQEFEKDILIQVAYTLNVMREFRLIHNDLHMENIFVVKRERTLLPYKINNKPYYSKYCVYIFDFDHSSVMGKFSNKLLDTSMCYTYGECNIYDDKWDWFTFLDNFLFTLPAESSLGIHFWNKWFPNHNNFTKEEEFGQDIGQRAMRGKACICLDEVCSDCEISREILDALPSPDDFIRAM
jgi:hypothetical protein